MFPARPQRDLLFSNSDNLQSLIRSIERFDSYMLNRKKQGRPINFNAQTSKRTQNSSNAYYKGKFFERNNRNDNKFGNNEFRNRQEF